MNKRKRRTPGPYTIEDMQHLYRRPDEATRPNGDSDRIDFDGSPWVAFSAETAQAFALGDIPGFDLAQRVYFASLARLEPRGAATFGVGELCAMLGAPDAKALGKAIRAAKDRGLILDDSDAREVWVSSSHAQRPVGAKYRCERVKVPPVWQGATLEEYMAA